MVGADEEDDQVLDGSDDCDSAHESPEWVPGDPGEGGGNGVPLNPDLMEELQARQDEQVSGDGDDDHDYLQASNEPLNPDLLVLGVGNLCTKEATEGVASEGVARMRRREHLDLPLCSASTGDDITRTVGDRTSGSPAGRESRSEYDSEQTALTAGGDEKEDGHPRDFSPPPSGSGGESPDSEGLAEDGELERDSNSPHCHVNCHTDTMSVVSGASVTSSYLHGEDGPAQVRRLVHRTLQKKQKEQQRQTRPKKEMKRAAAGSQRREKRAHKMKIKESLNVDFF